VLALMDLFGVGVKVVTVQRITSGEEHVFYDRDASE
jgi:hypothetical protein